jgi:hypothetical protein
VDGLGTLIAGGAGAGSGVTTLRAGAAAAENWGNLMLAENVGEVVEDINFAVSKGGQWGVGCGDL